MPSYSHHLLHLQQMSARYCSCSSGMSQLTATKTPSPTCCPSAAPPVPSSPPKSGQRLELHIQGGEHLPRVYQALAGHVLLLQPRHPHQERCCQHGWGSGPDAHEHFSLGARVWWESLLFWGCHRPVPSPGLFSQGCMCVCVCVCAAGCKDYKSVSSSSLRNPMSVVWGTGAGVSESGAVCSTPHTEGEGWELAPQTLNKEAPDEALKANPHSPAPSLFSFISMGSQLRADPP